MNDLDSITHDLVTNAIQGDAHALDRVLMTLERPFYNLALRMLLTHADAQDATQECLLRVVTRLSSFRGESRFSTWAWRVAIRRILDFQDGKRRRPMMSATEFAEDLADGLNRNALERPDDVVAVQQVKLGCGRAMLQCLDGDHRLAYVLGEIMEIPGPQAAEIVQVPPAAFRKRLSRARSHVREVMQAHCGLANEAAPCRCHRRVGRARARGRLAPEDRHGKLDVLQLQSFVRGVDELHRAAALYRADPVPSLPPARLVEIRRVLRMPI